MINFTTQITFHVVKQSHAQVTSKDICLLFIIYLFAYFRFVSTSFYFISWCKNAALVRSMTMIITVQLFIATYENFLFNFGIIGQRIQQTIKMKSKLVSLITRSQRRQGGNESLLLTDEVYRRLIMTSAKYP